MKQITAKESERILAHLDKAAALCAKYGMALGNGGDIASMLCAITTEIANGEARQIEDLAEEN